MLINSDTVLINDSNSISPLKIKILELSEAMVYSENLERIFIWFSLVQRLLSLINHDKQGVGTGTTWQIKPYWIAHEKTLWYTYETCTLGRVEFMVKIGRQSAPIFILS